MCKNAFRLFSFWARASSALVGGGQVYHISAKSAGHRYQQISSNKLRKFKS
jgi:hypothetical protein